jgi:hypothetical protein
MRKSIASRVRLAPSTGMVGCFYVLRRWILSYDVRAFILPGRSGTPEGIKALAHLLTRITSKLLHLTVFQWRTCPASLDIAVRRCIHPG